MKLNFRTLCSVASVVAMSVSLASCNDDMRTDGYSQADNFALLPLSEAQKEVIAYTPKNAVIAHRGTEFWAPEESEAAMRWARNIGADYLECDLQRTKDGVTLALHDENLSRTTDIEVIYPTRWQDYVSSFTFDELLKLDIGSWFNEANPEQARESFVGLDVLTLEDVIAIAEGMRIKRDENGKRIVERDAEGKYVRTLYEPDPFDNGNRPGVYIETKAPYLFAKMEETLRDVLEKTGWYAEDITKLKQIPTTPGKVCIANTPARVILQTFDLAALKRFDAVFTRKIPTLYLIADLTSTPTKYAELINYAIESGATAMGPNIKVGSYPSSILPWQAKMVQRSGLDVHAWTFNTQQEFMSCLGPWCDSEKIGGADKNAVDMVFTNHADIAIEFYRNTLEQYRAKGMNYFKSNASVRLSAPGMYPEDDNLQKNKPVMRAQDVLDQLGY